ncbi:MAG: hypothetical protein ACKO43_03780 [Alphaproteobacteria bacterium]
MKKNVVFLGFCLLGAHGASAESLDVFFQEQTPQEQPSQEQAASPVTPQEETPEKVTGEPTVVKPQVLYLEDLDPAEKPEPKPKPKAKAAAAPVPTPKTKTKTASAEAPKSSLVALPNPLTAAAPKATPAPASGKIKTEPLPETFAKTTTQSLAPAQQADTQKSFIQPRATQVNPEPDTIPESTQTLSSFREHNAGQYAPFATQTSRQQAAHSLVT